MIIRGKEEQEGITDPEGTITTNIHVPNYIVSSFIK